MSIQRAISTGDAPRRSHWVRRARPAVLSTLVVAALVACTPASDESGPAGQMSAQHAQGSAPSTTAKHSTSTSAAPRSTTTTIRVTPTTPTASTPNTTVAGTPVPGSTAGPAALSYITPGARMGLGGCALFPTNNMFHASIRDLAVTNNSAATTSAMGSDTVIMAGFSERVWEGSRLGLPTNVVDSRTAPKHFVAVADWSVDISENTAVPWPANPRLEGWPGRAWDGHLLTIDSAKCESWELINVMEPGTNLFAAILHPGKWYADRVVRRDLSSNEIPAHGSSSASGLSLLHGIVRYDEVASGRVDHVLTMAFPRISTRAVWPATRSDGVKTEPAAVPMGALLRLRDSVDISGLGPQAKVVAQAMKDHGVVINDTGLNAAITGEPDLRWNDADLSGLRQLTVGDFDVVDASPMKVADGSYQIR